MYEAHPHTMQVCTQCEERMCKAIILESVRCVCVWVNTKCVVCEKWHLIKTSMICIVLRSENHRMGAFEFEIELFFKLNLLNVFIKLCGQFRCDLRPCKYMIQSKLLLCFPVEVCGCGCGKRIKKHTCAVWECAGWKAIVCRVCGCAKIGCTQILWFFLIPCIKMTLLHVNIPNTYQ